MAAFNPECDCPKFINVAFVLVGSVLLTFAEFYLCKKAAKVVYSEDRKVPYDNLEKYGVETFATDKEVDEMLNDVFGEDEVNR